MAINRFHLTLSSTYRSNYRFRESVVSLSKSNHPESAPDSDFLSATSKLSVWRNASACAPTEWLTADRNWSRCQMMKDMIWCVCLVTPWTSSLDVEDLDPCNVVHFHFRFFSRPVSGLYGTKADVRHATKLSNFVAQLYRATKLPKQLSVFHRQTIATQTWLLVTQMTT